MKKLTLIMVVMLMVMVSCKTKKAISTYSPENPEYTNTEQTGNSESDPKSADEKPITYRTESVEVAQTEDQALAHFNFYVITGSFSSLENATTLKKQMKSLGFTPVILISESDMYRVTAEQTNSESDARNVINKIRNTYSEYKDVWLLKRK
jgi:cell division protein FtsN